MKTWKIAWFKNDDRDSRYIKNKKRYQGWKITTRLSNAIIVRHISACFFFLTAGIREKQTEKATSIVCRSRVYAKKAALACFFAKRRIGLRGNCASVGYARTLYILHGWPSRKVVIFVHESASYLFFRTRTCVGNDSHSDAKTSFRDRRLFFFFVNSATQSATIFPHLKCTRSRVVSVRVRECATNIRPNGVYNHLRRMRFGVLPVHVYNAQYL